MRLYKFTFPYNSTDAIPTFFLAENDYEFLRDCLGWAHEVTYPEELPTGSSAEAYKEWHMKMADYHSSYFEALKAQGFEMGESVGRWTSKEVTDEEVAILRRLGVVD